MAPDLSIFKAYDVRGTVPDQVDDDLARSVGNAFVVVTGASSVVVGHDMRPSSPALTRAFADGAAEAGADVTLIGLASTDQLYFASGQLARPGAMFTASHNPAQYNGIKMCRAHAQPIGMETGLAEIRDRVATGETLTADRRGTIDERDLLAE
jgi:phosphomannomutase